MLFVLIHTKVKWLSMSLTFTFCKVNIHKQKFAKCTPKSNLFLSEMDALKKSLMHINNKNNYILLDFMEMFFSDIAPPLQSLNMS